MLTQLLIVIFNFKYHFTFFYFSFVAIANCSSLFIKSIPRTLLCDKWRHNDLTVAVNSTEMVDQTRASFQGAILRCRRKKEIEPKDRAQVDEGNQREAQRVRVLSTRFGPHGQEEKRGPSCSRPRNNVSGLWFFIRARSHNGLSQSDSST